VRVVAQLVPFVIQQEIHMNIAIFECLLKPPQRGLSVSQIGENQCCASPKRRTPAE
jgi:hypothetical protein